MFLPKMVEIHPYLACFYQKWLRYIRISHVFTKNRWDTPVSRMFLSKMVEIHPYLACFYQKQAIVIPRTGNLRPVGVCIKFGTTQNGLKQTFINKELCNFSHFQVNVKSYDNFSLFVRWMKTRNGCTDVLVHPFFSIRFAGLVLRNILQNIQQMIPNHLHRWNEQTLVRSVDVAQGRAKADHV